jgi:lipoprotein-anchoring transpeptidase ErfK/SrfK
MIIKVSHILTGALAAAALLAADWATAAPLSLSHNMYAYSRADQMGPVEEQTEQSYATPPQFKRQIVAYTGSEAPGTIILDTPNTFLYLVQPGGRAIRYGIGVGRDGFRWSGVQHITKKAEWPDWTPPPEMIARQPYLPRFMAGGPTNPLGARAMYLGNTIYRIHGTNAPSTIGSRVSSGCIRLVNDDVIDLASRVNVGTKVVVINSADHQASAPMISAPANLRLR